MSWLLNPESMVKNLLAACGVSPEDFVNFLRSVSTEIAELRADRLAFKPASAKAYQDVTARLTRLEAKIDLLIMTRESEAFRAARPHLLENLSDERDNERDISGHD